MSGRIRSIKPEWLEDEKLAAASDEARLLSVALILMADDYGRGRASIACIASGAWRYQMERNDGAEAPEILARASRAFRECLALGFAKVYEVNGQRYFEIVNWTKHQRVDKPSKPRIPAPDSAESLKILDPRETLASVSRDSSETLAKPSRLIMEEERDKEQEGERESAQARDPLPLTDTRGLVLRAFRSRWEQQHGSLWPGPRGDPSTDSLVRWIDQQAAHASMSAESVIDRVLTHWWADTWVIGRNHPWSHFAKSAGEFWNAKPQQQRKHGPAPVRTAAEFAAEIAENGAETNEF